MTGVPPPSHPPAFFHLFCPIESSCGSSPCAQRSDAGGTAALNTQQGPKKLHGVPRGALNPMCGCLLVSHPPQQTPELPPGLFPTPWPRWSCAAVGLGEAAACSDFAFCFDTPQQSSSCPSSIGSAPVSSCTCRESSLCTSQQSLCSSATASAASGRAVGASDFPFAWATAKEGMRR